MSFVGEDFEAKRQARASDRRGYIFGSVVFAVFGYAMWQNVYLALLCGTVVPLLGLLSGLKSGTRRILYDNNSGITIEKYKGNNVVIPWQDVVSAKERFDSSDRKTDYVLTYKNKTGRRSELFTNNNQFYQFAQEKLNHNTSNQIGRGD